MKFLQFILFVFCGTVLSAQEPCISYEEKMNVYRDVGSDLNIAMKIYEDYIAEDCADRLLAYNFIGFAYYNKSNFQKAREYLMLGENIFLENKTNQHQYALNQMYTGLIYIAENDFESAEYHLEKAKKWISPVNDNFIQASIFQNIGLVKIKTENFNDAERYLKKAINAGVLDTIAIGYIYQNLALLYLNKGQTKEAKEYIDRTNSVWNKIQYSKGIYLLSFLQARLSIQEKEYSKALIYLEQGRAIYDEEDRLLSGENYLIEAQTYDSLNNKNAQLTALENAIFKSDDLSKIQLEETIVSLSELQSADSMNLVLAGLISKLKSQNLGYKKINLERTKVMDSESEEDQSTIKTQLKYLVILASFLLLITYLFLRTSSQNAYIQDLNTNLNFSKIEAENQLEKVKQKNKELEQFAYVASHDLKSPLRTISLFAGLLKKKYGSDNEYLDKIIRSSQNLSSMISELLRYSTLNQQLNIESLNLHKLIQETTDRLSSQISDSKTSIVIDDSCHRQFNCDKLLFINVFQNLISNSITYSKEDTAPQISISAFDKDHQLVIELTDNGIGMEEPYLDTIFEMFTRLKTKNVDGTGIGLSTCKKIVENHKGSISVKSKVGVGSTFSIEIPYDIE